MSKMRPRVCPSVSGRHRNGALADAVGGAIEDQPRDILRRRHRADSPHKGPICHDAPVSDVPTTPDIPLQIPDGPYTALPQGPRPRAAPCGGALSGHDNKCCSSEMSYTLSATSLWPFSVQWGSSYNTVGNTVVV